ncbi:MAG: hypothetical protein ACT4PP_08085 [Sporichthyaceae bacterium]
MTSSSTCRAVETIVNELCERAGVYPVPQVVIGGRSGGSVHRRGQRYVIRIGRRLARRGGPRLRGTIAHEIAHVEHQDPGAIHEVIGDRTHKTYAETAALLGCALLAGTAAGMLTYSRGSRELAPAAAVNTTMILTVLLLAVYLRTGLRREASFALARRPWVELRADLRAVQLVGHTPVLAFLPTGRLRQLSENAAAAVFGRTHPNSCVRGAAVASYDPTEDPGTAATRLLRGHPDPDQKRA